MATRILVIDDEPVICRLIEYQLGSAGYRVMACQRAHDALLLIANEAPDLILLDVMMPGISGWDLCRQIRASSTVPIIMLTAKHGDEDIVTGLTSGADDYVGKPFSAAALIARIEAVLRRSRSANGQRRPTPAPIEPAAAPAAETPAPGVASSLADRPRARETEPVENRLPRLGPLLAEARRQRRLSLHDAGEVCGVRWEFLQAIEREQFSYVPRDELRHALRTYSAMLDVDLSPYLGHGGQRRRRIPGALPLTVGVVAVLAMALVVVILIL
ncbi:MAG: response regulator [Oscillochloridaceae bacterium]|nr:response regulator [Oscillochloridaceae bacterium]